MESRTITVQGQGDYVLQLESGALTILKDGVALVTAKGDPSKRGKPAFASLDEAEAYFNKTDYATPIIPPPAEEPTEPAN